MEALFKSGSVVDLILVVMVLEVFALLLFNRRFGWSLADVAGQFLAGAFLLCALRCTMKGLDWPWTAVFLAASFPAHLYDLWRRGRLATPWR